LRGESPFQKRHRLFLLAWHGVNFLLLVAVVAAAYTTAWEYSTRRYLKGFSDAIIPETAPVEEKIQSILSWMSSPAAQLTPVLVGEPSHRNPIDTLNFQALLQVCGTATNAFVNLAVSDGLAARRLLLDPSSRTKHVDAEVLVNGRWIVVDPAFRVILRSPNGQALTRDELAIPATFSAATRNIPHYDPRYSFERTAHVRLARLGFIGTRIQKALDSLIPGWDDSVTISLILERESLAAMAVVIAIALVLSLLRISLRWYGEKHLLTCSIRMRHRLREAYQAFLRPRARGKHKQRRIGPRLIQSTNGGKKLEKKRALPTVGMLRRLPGA
jgi:hypothetical protein